jgi:hypothetical protein
MMKKMISATAILFLAATGWAQFVDERRPLSQPGKTSAVEFLAPDQIALPAGKPTRVLVHFRVQQGLHINSHKPHDEFLIPTAFTITEGKGVRMESVAYPEGHDVTLPADPKTKLNVYTGDFALDAVLVATPGEHVVEGKLRFQACDQRQCMPPKTLPVTIVVTGK